MHYWDSKNTYDNIHMKNYSQNNLPMDEFAKGNFSQAHKIIDTYREYIAKCITSLTHQNTWGEKNISDYLDKKLVELEKQHKEWTEKKTKAIQEKKIIQKEINKEKKSFKDEWEGNKFRDIYFNYLEKESRDIKKFKRAFKESFKNESQKNESKTYIDELHKVFEKCITSAPTYIYKIKKLEEKFAKTKKEINKATHMLSNRSNRQNFDKQIYNIKSWNGKIEIENKIKTDLLRMFKKTDHMNYTVDTRNLQEIFTSFITTQLITNYNTDKQLKKNLIKNHTDKLWLFDHIRNIYQTNSQIFLNRETWRKGSKHSEYRENIINDKINEIAEVSREILNKLPDISFYFWADRNSPEDIEKQQNTSSEDWKKYVIEDLIIHLKKLLSEQEKKWDWRQEPNSKIKKLFEWIYSVTESHEFENYCENLWDIDANKYWEITWAKGKKLLTQIYQSMDEEEQTTIKNDYNSQWLDSITQNIETQKVKTEDKQLKLYNFAPIYNNEWYIEKISTHIESLIGKLEFKQKRKLEDIARQMLTEQWNNNYIHTDREISPLLEQEFIKRIKESRWGKTLSLKLKKIKEKLLPDINERITETKKTNKEDII